jgi:hypothetical protein
MGAFKRGAWLAAGLLALARGPLWAWDPELHAVVAAMAQARLSPRARAGLIRLRMDAAVAGVDLRCHEGDPAFRFIDRDLGRFLDLDHPPDLALLGSWADGWRTGHPETAAWHFIELDPRGPLDALAVDNACPNQDCVPAQITRQQGLLADASLDPRTRFMALCFLVHLVADAHQPLHCAGMDQDHGGNRRLVLCAGQALSLHAAWDQGFLEAGRAGGRGRKKRGKRAGQDRPHPGAWDHRQAAALAKELGQGIRADDAWEWTRNGPDDWVLESAEEARRTAYGALGAGPPPQILGRDYLNRARPVVRRQLQRAAVRLAALLDDSLR